MLLYLNATRSNITFCTQQLSQFLSASTVTHFNVACRILKYLKTCPAQGIIFLKDPTLQLSGYSDDWEGSKISFRIILFLGISLISWRTKKQLTLLRSSSEAEYRAFAAVTCELQLLLYFMDDLHTKCIRTSVIYCDNQNALHIVSNMIFYEITKHLEIGCHIVREKQSKGVMKIPVKSKDQFVDLFTKALHPQPFNDLLAKLKMINND